MDINGHATVREAIEDLVYVAPMPEGVESQRYLTVQVSGVNHDVVLNALHNANLMRVNSPRDAIFSHDPELQVVTGSTDYLTFEDLNAR